MSGTHSGSLPRLRILFDGECGLCSKTVQFFLRNETAATFVFTPIQSEAGRILAAAANLNPDDPSSFAVFDQNGAARLKSDGAFYALTFCRRPWRGIAALCRCLPPGLCDAVYDHVARRRLGFFGKTDVCALAPAPLRARLETSAACLV